MPGTREANCAFGVGLRTSQHRFHLVTNQTSNINAQPMGGAASAAVTTFTTLALAKQANPYCTTLVALIAQGTPVAGTIQLRIKGFDQFGQEINSTTPLVTLAAKTNNYVYLSHTMAYVTSVEFVSTGLDIASDTISLGQRWDWTRTNDGTNEHLHGRNLGIAVMMRLARRPTGPATTRKFSTPLPAHMPFFGMFNTAVAQSLLPSVHQSNQARGKATMWLNGNAVNGGTVTVGTVVYTFNTVLGGANSVLIGATTADSAQNLRDAVAASGPGVGVTFGTGTVAHPDVFSAEDRTIWMTVVAREPGARGNLIAIADTITGGWQSPLPHLDGGYDSPVEVVGIQAIDQTGLVSDGSIMTLGANQVTIGDNDVGWEGPAEKIHVLFAADVANWAITDDVFVDMDVQSKETANE